MKLKLTDAQISTLREMSSYQSPYWFRTATCRSLEQLGFAEQITNHKRPGYRITTAGRAALSQEGE